MLQLLFALILSFNQLLYPTGRLDYRYLDSSLQTRRGHAQNLGVTELGGQVFNVVYLTSNERTEHLFIMPGGLHDDHSFDFPAIASLEPGLVQVYSTDPFMRRNYPIHIPTILLEARHAKP